MIIEGWEGGVKRSNFRALKQKIKNFTILVRRSNLEDQNFCNFDLKIESCLFPLFEDKNLLQLWAEDQKS